MTKANSPTKATENVKIKQIISFYFTDTDNIIYNDRTFGFPRKFVKDLLHNGNDSRLRDSLYPGNYSMV